MRLSAAFRRANPNHPHFANPRRPGQRIQRRPSRPRPHGDPGPRSRADQVGPKASGPRRKPTRTINTGTGKRPIERGTKRPIGRGPKKPKQLTTSEAAIRRAEARLGRRKPRPTDTRPKRSGNDVRKPNRRGGGPIGASIGTRLASRALGRRRDYNKGRRGRR